MIGEYISPQALAAHLGNGTDIVVVDVRSREAYTTGHIPGALSIPSERLAKRLEEIARDKPVVVYCSFRRPGHTPSESAGVLLRESGFAVKVLYGGHPAWREAGFAVEKPEAQPSHG
ncbi:MAG: rhodanese-like domain-containing protein [Anaerolineae bacterium]